MDGNVTRRGWIAGVAGGVAMTATQATADTPPTTPAGFGFCLNTSTIRVDDGSWGKSRPIVELIDIAAKAGYQAIEPWVSEIDVYVKGGGQPKTSASESLTPG